MLKIRHLNKHIWKSKSSFVFEGRYFEPQSMVLKAQEDAEIWMEVHKTETHSRRNGNPSQTLSFHWKKPPLDILKCNIGTSWINHTRNYSVAWLIRDYNGRVMFHERRSYSGIATSFEAELMCMFWAVESLSTLHFKNVLFESSSKQEIQAIFRHLIADCRRFMSTFEEERVLCVPTNDNYIASEMAKNVTKEHHYQSYIAQDGLSWLGDCIISEASIGKRENWFSLVVSISSTNFLGRSLFKGFLPWPFETLWLSSSSRISIGFS